MANTPAFTSTGLWASDTPTPTTLDFAPTAPLHSGTVTGITQTTLTDSTATWTVNQFTDKIVKISLADSPDYEWAVVLSNTATELTFDDNLIFGALVYTLPPTYEVVDTLVLRSEDMPLITAIDLRTNNCGILLPNSIALNERKYCHVYAEMANGTKSAGIVCRGTERQLGAKYGMLFTRGEGYRLYGHQWMIPHWDILDSFNIKRFANGYFSADEAVASATYVTVGASLTYDNVIRFIEYPRDGLQWARYISLQPRDFLLKFSCTVTKSGTGGEMTISFAKRDGATGVITNLTDREATTRFGGGTGVADITVEVPVSLNRNDEIIPIAKRDTGTFAINSGSTVSVTEL